ncbi:hypothetical protein E2C01_009427 [Portunus trituberculatus]|uniref:Uncharacterized protein n=1 Tax=Portunus trituberculatus TaxID=210409 RepID=A0A5B7D4S7_PORTR|nr:hypothetical protein [Portunus trituberculatus]
MCLVPALLPPAIPQPKAVSHMNSSRGSRHTQPHIPVLLNDRDPAATFKIQTLDLPHSYMGKRSQNNAKIGDLLLRIPFLLLSLPCAEETNTATERVW